METFDLHNVTAILPDADGSCLVAQSREVRRLVPYAQDPHRLEIRTSMIVRTMEFIASHDNDRKYVQLTSGGNWYQGYNTTERHPRKTYTITTPSGTVLLDDQRTGQMQLRWSHYGTGPGVYENAKGLTWFTPQGMTLCTARGARRREGGTLDLRAIGDFQLNDRAVRVPGTATVLTIGSYIKTLGSGYPTYRMARLFDAASGKFLGEAETEIMEVPAPFYPRVTKTGAGSMVLHYTGSAAPPVWNEVMPDLTVREPPAWYPDPATLSPDSEIIRPSILKDRAAWVGLDRALYYRTAETGKLRRFRPHGRRRVRGCAFAPDGQTLWAFDSACVFRVDVDD